MNKIILTILAAFSIAASSVNAELNEKQRASTLKHNLVSLAVRICPKGKPLDSKCISQHGFGWVVGNDNSYLYVITANHVVRVFPPVADEIETEIDAKFFADPNSPHKAELLSTSSKEKLDLAMVKVPLPDRRPWLYSSLGPEEIKLNTAVSFVGMNKNWAVPSKLGQIKRLVKPEERKKYDVIARGLPVDVGTSGAPLISKDGIVGMIVTTSGEDSGVVSLKAIKRTVEDEWNIPWGLSASEQSIDMAGVWVPMTPNIPKNIRVKFQKSENTMHFEYKLEFPSSPRGNAGLGVIDGREVRIWQSLESKKDSFGIFQVAIDKSKQSGEGIVMDGWISDGNLGPTQLRLAKLKTPNGDDIDPRAQAWMKDNPSDFENMAARFIPKDPNISDEEHIASLGKNEQSTILAGVVQGVMFRSGLMRLARAGLPNVKLNIKSNCYTASGSVPSAAKHKEVDDILVSLVDEANFEFDKNYSACNETMVSQSMASETGTNEFDFEAELVQPRQLLSTLAPNAKLSVQGECVLLEGQLSSSIQKLMLKPMLKTLSKELSAKSKQKLKACDKTVAN